MKGIDALCAMIRRGMRFVPLPAKEPLRVRVVIEYDGVTVRREIEREDAPAADVAEVVTDARRKM